MTGAAWLAAALAALAVALLLPARIRFPPSVDPTLVGATGTSTEPSDPTSGAGGGVRSRGRPTPALGAALGAAAGVLVLAPSGTGLLAAAVVGAVVHRKVAAAETGAARRRRLVLEAELPHVVDLLGSLLVAGAAPEEALARVRAVVHPVMSEELAPWVERLRLGADPVSVWADLARHPSLARLGTTLGRAAASGAPVADALGRLGADLRAVVRTATLERVRQVEVRATAPLAVCLLPAFVLLGVVPLVAGTVGQLGLG